MGNHEPDCYIEIKALTLPEIDMAIGEIQIAICTLNRYIADLDKKVSRLTQQMVIRDNLN